LASLTTADHILRCSRQAAFEERSTLNFHDGTLVQNNWVNIGRAVLYPAYDNFTPSTAGSASMTWQ
jgi:hypothetical protein